MTHFAGYLNDLWLFDLSTGWWRWIDGSSGRNQLGSFGVLGVASPANVPGARSLHSMAFSDALKRLYVFGGTFYTDFWNDFWMYDLRTARWTWLGGSTLPNAFGDYSAVGAPGSRCGHAMAQDDANSTIYVMGGNGFASSGKAGI